MQIDQLRENALDAVGSATDQATRVASDVADKVTSTLEAAADGIGDGLERAKDAVAAVSGDPAPVRRRRWPWVVAVAVVAGALVAVALRARSRSERNAAPAGAARFRVTRDDDERWVVADAGSGAKLSDHDTQAQGIDRATDLASAAGGGEVTIHGLDGRPREVRTVGPSSG